MKNISEDVDAEEVDITDNAHVVADLFGVNNCLGNKHHMMRTRMTVKKKTYAVTQMESKMNKELETRSIECEKMNQRSSGFDEKMETLKEKMYFAIGSGLQCLSCCIFYVLFLANELRMLIACVWCA
eukprot:335651_1